jgi:hypothetical protein
MRVGAIAFPRWLPVGTSETVATTGGTSGPSVVAEESPAGRENPMQDSTSLLR